MKLGILFFSLLVLHSTFASPTFKVATPKFQGNYDLKPAKLCATAKQTLAYLNKGIHYDPKVIHEGKVVRIPLARIKASLGFICQHQNQLNNPAFIKQHFDFIRWYPDLSGAQHIAAHKPLVQHIPHDRILMTKYFVHLAKASTTPTINQPYALYALPKEEQHLSLAKADLNPNLIRFQFGKQAILQGALKNKAVPTLAYLSREDLEMALLQGTVVADFGSSLGIKIFNVHRNNNQVYDRTKTPYQQERFWYFKRVEGIKGYGKDAEYKITVDPEVTFAADLAEFGLGKILLVQYKNPAGVWHSKAAILADTGGAFSHNLYQVDYLAGSYSGQSAYRQATRSLPDYVEAYFMVLKPNLRK